MWCNLMLIILQRLHQQKEKSKEYHINGKAFLITDRERDVQLTYLHRLNMKLRKL